MAKGRELYVITQLGTEQFCKLSGSSPWPVSERLRLRLPERLSLFLAKTERTWDLPAVARVPGAHGMCLCEETKKKDHKGMLHTSFKVLPIE